MSAAENTYSPLDRPLTVTFFPNFGARDKREELLSLNALAPRIKNTTNSAKDKLPWLKLASFGTDRTKKGSLRHDKNVLTISGVEGDYDAEIMTVDEAVAIMRSANLAGMIYTSPSHTEDTPRWRVLCPLSHDADPGTRTILIARLNGVFCGGLSGESFTLSQSYYFGCINQNPSHRVELVDGAFIDERADLDAGAVGKPKIEYKTPDKPPQPRVQNTDRFVEAVIKRALERVSSAPEKQKHYVLLAQARLLGGYQHIGGYSTSEAADWLVAALPSTAKDLDAARTTAEWGLEKGAEQPLSVPELPPRSQPEPPPFDPQDPGYDLGNVAFMREHELDQAPLPPEPPKKKTEERDHSPLPLLYFRDIQPVLDARDFVQGTLMEQGAAVVYGESNAGKTFWATDLSLRVSAGMQWNGKRVDQGGVVYVVMEGGNGFRNRVSAWRTSHQMQDFDLPFAAVPVSVNLLDPAADTDRLIIAIETVAKEMDIPVKLVVIDTLSRALAGGNENAPDDMGALVMNMDRIREKTKACVLFVHHSGKDQAKGARGHSLLRAAIDTEIEVVADDDAQTRTATVVKQRELPKGQTYRFSLKIMSLGENQHGEDVTTCLVEPEQEVDGKASGQPKRTVTGHTKRALDVLLDLLAASGRTGDQGVPSGFASVPEKWWRDQFYERAMPAAEQEAKKRAFRRAADSLLDMRIIGMASARVWAL